MIQSGGRQILPPRGRLMAWGLLIFSIFARLTAGSLLRGIAYHSYQEGDELEVIATKLTSKINQLPYDYYSLPFCDSQDVTARSRRVNLGQLLSGERAKTTDFQFRMNKDQQCTLMCTVLLQNEDAAVLQQRIGQMYSVRLSLDHMPVVVKGTTKSGNVAYQLGYPLGFVEDESHYINNYLRLKVLVHRERDSDRDYFQVVGFEVEPRSLPFYVEQGQVTREQCTAPRGEALKVEAGTEVPFVYDVIFEESEMNWATRWDHLLKPSEDVVRLQWSVTMNSMLVGVFLTALVGFILLRTVLRDFVRYNQLDQEAPEEDSSGWKVLHSDVFRTPRYAASLCVFVGTGTQVFTMAAITQVFAVAGLVSRGNRAALLTAMLLLWVATSLVSGYTSARLYASLKGAKSRKWVTTATAFLFSGITFITFFVLNLVLSMFRSQAAVPLRGLVGLLLLWFCLAIPLVFVGAYLGYKRRPHEFPVRTNQIPRAVPKSPIPFARLILPLAAGIFPFCSFLCELTFILNTMWLGQIYFLFGFLLAVFALLTVTCGELSIVFTYVTLSNEDHRWWWPAFLASGSSGLYVMLYSIYYLKTHPGFHGVTLISVLIYMVYMNMISVAFALMTGAIGFHSSFFFVRRIYGAIRIE
mmetsp:Transcript_8363/g.37381  ORF Transcript_8363/g.37381 Transcript_8363/m.37381 type:complete len:639 (-) Transcript_8363:2411-4327(-)|eukprot:CAMPEP_0113958242 /NCGR_PEP_ID=MMETSP0011_2-20120614/3274_1 /TAXON_ID=101924 /ORGANISM="Rhodosorus marinus" /LENGTH=638 /DNA_ID=CAMNT_0000969009 /DNA_START=184 /DNA_END=2100 /DNA_ORIENTATION=+ /assembly_acc=CAM_ASM_000156